jgi:hypothetical protein
MQWLVLICCAVSLGAEALLADDAPPLYKDPTAPIQARVDDLLNRMTLEEKVAQPFAADVRRNFPTLACDCCSH